MRYYLVIGLMLLSQWAYAQVKELKPTSVELLDLGPEGEKAFKKAPIDKEDYWDIMEGGCSWYCDGGPKTVTASSFLKSQGTVNYHAKNAHDLNYKNAWAEGVPGYGIGEFLLYTFRAASPRINKIIIVNGYIKNRDAWVNNSRVKKLKLYVNDKPYAILNLQDIRGAQTFEVLPIGNGERRNLEALEKRPDWTLKFEILEVYKGNKYDDVVISELYFDGLDVHCFAKGTRVLMADKSSKYIEDLQVGDHVACMDTHGSIRSAKVEQLASVTHGGLVTYRFESGRMVTVTQDHPFQLQHKGWASLKPDGSKQYQGFDDIGKIGVGDVFLTVDGPDRLLAIDFLEGRQETYTISKLSAGGSFIANGLIVGVEALDEADHQE